MKTNKRSSIVALFISLTLLTIMCGSTLFSRPASAQIKLDPTRPSPQTGDKLSIDLREKVEIAAGAKSVEGKGKEADEVVRVILQLNGSPRSRVNDLLGSSDARVDVDLDNLNTKVIELPVSAVERLAQSGDVKFMSLDRPVEMLGHIENTTGAALMRIQSGNSTFDGRGIGIAVLDSGIFGDHKSFLDDNDRSRIVVSRDYTGNSSNLDEDFYGHGTHVSGLMAGGTRGISSTYKGIAPGAKIINLRVLDAQGRGTTSGLLNALNWVLSNRTAYNIRVANLSLGTMAVDSYRNDPLCQAVRRLVDAGIVVVAAAGNNGKNSAGQKVYGHIHSPGNEPSALTVGATNTAGTDWRGDDTIASYSSRGPTRGYWTDAAGVKHYDNLIKPDLVAPGNQLVAAQAEDNAIIEDHPELDASITHDEEKDMMRLSGTSMATPIVAGTVALMLQANPNLTPDMVKAILMYTAQPVANFNMFEQGAGQVNVEGAIKLAKLVRRDLTNNTLLGTAMLTTATPPIPQTTIAGYTFPWAQGIIAGFTHARGTELITRYQKIYGTGIVLGDGVVLSEGILLGDMTMMSSGILLGDFILTSNGVILGDGSPFLSCGILLGEGILLGDNIILGDGILLGDSSLLGDGILLGDVISQSHGAMVFGEPGSCADCE